MFLRQFLILQVFLSCTDSSFGCKPVRDGSWRYAVNLFRPVLGWIFLHPCAFTLLPQIIPLTGKEFFVRPPFPEKILPWSKYAPAFAVFPVSLRWGPEGVSSSFLVCRPTCYLRNLWYFTLFFHGICQTGLLFYAPTGCSMLSKLFPWPSPKRVFRNRLLSLLSMLY
jgi:hypothetical protein